VSRELQDDLFAFFEQMGKFHPVEPHWYLPMIGVDPTRQNKGYGSMLMRQALAACDREQLPAYLESSNPRNITLYVRHGFEIVGTIQAGSSPPMFAMRRAARTRNF
jgi:ribosomal protein S18 acetylase RimI-like enzyme